MHIFWSIRGEIKGLETSIDFQDGKNVHHRRRIVTLDEGGKWCYTESLKAVASAARPCGIKELAGFELAAGMDPLGRLWEIYIEICR